MLFNAYVGCCSPPEAAGRMRLVSFVGILLLLEVCSLDAIDEQKLGDPDSFPLIVITWNYTDATKKAWDVIYNQKRSALDAIEEGCSLCEEQQCRKTVGFGGSPDEAGETTLDALIMDGVPMDVGGVGGLRNVKSAISVARKVLEHTKHSLLGGDLATDFAVNMGFKKESLQTNESKEMWTQWRANKCQPNFWRNVVPDPTTACGPYRSSDVEVDGSTPVGSEENHDTIAIVAIDSQTRIAAGTSTNGAKHKIPGRIGDSPIAGAGAYADQDAGAAAGTGDGDIMMRFLPSFLAVEEMRNGATPSAAAKKAIDRIAQHYPNFFGGVIALNRKGEYGAACNGMAAFHYYVANPTLGPKLLAVQCSKRVTKPRSSCWLSTCATCPNKRNTGTGNAVNVSCETLGMDYATVIDDAVRQFYSAGNNEAHSWLLQVQASPEAWQFVWQLLDPSKSYEVQFFAATTLHAKISKQWNEVPEAEYPVLRERLLNSVRRPNIPLCILIKLCQALAAFVASVYSAENRERDRSIVDELLDMLPYDSPSALELLLRVLSTLPIEYEKRQEAKIAKLRGAPVNLINSWCQTAWFLQRVFSMCNLDSQGNDDVLYSLGLECAQSWLKVGQLCLETTGQIYPYLLVAAAHYAPNKDETHGDDETMKSWDVVQDCLIMIVTHYELHKRPQTFWEWARSLVLMAKQYNRKYFCEILTAIGEAHSRAFLIALAENSNEAHTWTAMGLIELLLECSELEGRYPTDETRSCIPFGFWYALQDDLATLDQPLENRALEALKPIYFRLAQALLRKSTLPTSPNERGDADERELFRCYRQDVADTLDYCYSVLGSDLLALLGQRLSLEDSPWTHIESTLHAFKALSESVGTQEYCYIPALINLIIVHIPYHLYPEEVLTCACSTLGAYAEWIGEHPEPWLEKVLQLVIQGLTRGSTTAPFASMALKDLTRECGPYLAPYAPSILHTISQTLPNVEPGGGEGLRLMYAAGKLLNVLSSMEEQLVHLEATLGLCVTKIKELLGQPLFTARLGVTNYLKMVTMFFSTIEGAIGRAVLDGVLSVFNQIVTHPEWSQDNATLEAMHMCAQRSLSALRQPEIEARPLLLILLTSYKIWPHPAALNLLKQLVLLFGRDPDNIVSPVLAEMSSLTLNGVKVCRSVQGDLSEWSDLMEAYMGVLAQICKKNARLLLQIPDQIPDMLQCGIACLTLPETATAKAAGHFLSHAIVQSPHLQTFIQPIGQELVAAILHCVGGAVPHNLEPHAEVLLALNKTCPEWTAQWLRAGLENQKNLAAVLQKEDVTRILREKTNRGRLCDVLKEFSNQCHQKTDI